MSGSTIPASRDFVTQLLNSLPSLHRDNAEVNPLVDAPESVKKQLLSLQVLFPNEFLPALDLLDRRLVTCFRIGVEELNATVNNNGTTAADVQIEDTNEASVDITGPTVQGSSPVPQNTSKHANTVHYVRSAQQRSSRFSTSYDSTTSYEVRLHVWNCTCPAFAFAAFPSAHPEPAVPTYTPSSTIKNNGGAAAENKGALDYVFGGISLGEGMPPVCKHLLACVLAENCSGVFGQCMEERRIGVETAAGWAAGWGDL
ncbi:ubiquitin carboxyl-terminal hydrolase family protein [Stagonosporopsis vannaccii]|nr:ubiquitin carboxyl-terminal hydrolase family protein [Stagonosporopsis vannaccii]